MELKKIITIPIDNDNSFIQKSIELLDSLPEDILIIDDGSSNDIYELITDFPKIKYIRHEKNLGIGASFITAYEYARDFDYDIFIMLDPDIILSLDEIKQLMINIDYGYDIVTCSRILENFDYQQIPPDHIKIVEALSAAIKDSTNYDLTDPLSGIIALRMNSIKDMTLTDFSHGIFLQLWIQSHYYGLSVIEIPAASGKNFSKELEFYDDPLGYFLSIIESEKYLYKKGQMN